MESDTDIILPSGKILGKRKIFSDYNNDELNEVIKEARNIKHIIDILKIHRSYHNKIKQYINDNNININHFNLKSEENVSISTKLIIGDKQVSSKSIKQYLISNNIVKNECSICKIPPLWNNSPLTLQLDHINGNHYDNRVGNLRLICPNCHSQTETYTGRNLRQYEEKKCSDCSKKIKNDNTTGKCIDCLQKTKHLCSLCKINTKYGHNSRCKSCLLIEVPIKMCKKCNKPIKRIYNKSEYHRRCNSGTEIK